MQHTLCPKCNNSVGLDLDTCPYCGLDIRKLRETADMNYDLYKKAIDEGIADAKKGDFGLLRQIAYALTFETVSLSPVRLDPKLGISLFKKLDELGDVDAEYWIGRAYFNGVYFEKDVNKALDCLNNAAMNDSTLALRGLGAIMLNRILLKLSRCIKREQNVEMPLVLINLLYFMLEVNNVSKTSIMR